MPKAKKQNFRLDLNLNVAAEKDVIPIIGFHSPTGTFRFKDRNWKIAIAGGVQAIWIDDPQGNAYSIDIGQIAVALATAIADRKKKGAKS